MMGFNNSWKKIFSVYIVSGLIVLSGFNVQAQQEQAENKELIQAVNDLKKHVQILQDIEEIKHLHFTYLKHLMFCEWEELGKLFSEDAVLSAPGGDAEFKGSAAIGNFFKNSLGKSARHVGKEAIMGIHPIISVDGDRAKANWMNYLVSMDDPDSEQLTLVQAIYDFEYVRKNGEWKIFSSKFQKRLTLGPVVSLGDTGGSNAGSGGESKNQ